MASISLKSVHKQFADASVVYVTHDQVEAGAESTLGLDPAACHLFLEDGDAVFATPHTQQE